MTGHDTADSSEPATVPPASPAPAQGAAWYPDPAGRFARRWWDGTAWTAYVGSDGQGGKEGDVQWDPPPGDRTSGGDIEERRPGVAIAVAGFAIGAALSIAAARALPEDAGLGTELLVPSAALWVGLLGATVVAHRRSGAGSFAGDVRLRFRWIDVAYGLVGSVAGRLLTGIAASPIPLPSTRLRDLDRAPQEVATDGAWLALFVVICVGAPLFEELLFRGLLQPRLVARFGPVVGIGLASALFGAAHLLGWNGPFTLVSAWAIAFGGIALGTLRHYTGRLGAPILAHAFFNGQVFLLLYLTR